MCSPNDTDHQKADQAHVTVKPPDHRTPDTAG